MALIPLIRIIALSIVLAFAVIVLGLSAALTATTEEFLSGFFEFAALAIATASLTLLTLPIMIALEFMRPGTAFTSMITVELSWLSILWVLWLATAADTAQAAQLTFISGCGYFDSTFEGACRETAGIQAFAFLNWIILSAYTVLILVLSIIATSRRHTGVWRSSVAQAPFFTPGAASATQPTTSQPASAPAGSYSAGYVTQPYTPQPVTQHTTGGTTGPVTQHTTGGTMGGTGPASVQAGTIHV